MSDAIYEAFLGFVNAIERKLLQLPVTRPVMLYIERSYQNDPIRVALELFLFLWALYYVFKKQPPKDTTKLTDEVGQNTPAVTTYHHHHQ